MERKKPYRTVLKTVILPIDRIHIEDRTPWTESIITEDGTHGGIPPYVDKIHGQNPLDRALPVWIGSHGQDLYAVL